jgi:oligopeptide/dipeptide ABC transporter ATP-binding protein
MSNLLEVRDLSTHFPITGGIMRRRIGTVFALSDVSFSLREGETLGVVGESGCGKTTLGRTLVRLYEPTAGSIRYRGREIGTLGDRELMPLRRELQMIFQDPFASLNPRMAVGRILEEPLVIHGVAGRGDRRRKVEETLALVGLRPEQAAKFPHEFSGGQRQRIGIARALMLEPRLVIADEPVSALDVSVQAQVLNLLAELQARLGLTFVFISHDLTVVKYISDRVAVMYLGRIVELADSEAVYREPRHPYTRALLAALPSLQGRPKARREPVSGDLPSPRQPPSGCAFHPRCRYATDVCRQELPLLRAFDGDPEHTVACHLAEEI